MTDAAQESPHREVSPFDICSSCGCARKDRALKCDFCKADHKPQAFRPPRFLDELWVWIESTFQCRTCGFSVPLNHVDMDGAVVCGKCGAEQAFDVKGWHYAFDLAHNTAESGPGNQGWSKETFDTGNQFTVLAVAGHPLCETCHGLLSFTANGGTADVSCGACKIAVSYKVPEAATKTTHGALRAVISPEHRADRNEVKVDETGVAVAIRCPQCEAPLDASAGTKFVHCKYCNMTSRIPDDVWHRVNGNDPKPVPIWLAFSGTSPGKRLEQKKMHDKAQKALHDREVAEEQQKRALQHAHEQAAHEARVAHEKAAKEAEKAKAQELEAAKQKKQANLVVLAIVGFSVLCGVAAAVYATTAQSAPAPAADETEAPTPTPKATSTTTHIAPQPPAMHSASQPHRH